jgi:hypothetical protein
VRERSAHVRERRMLFRRIHELPKIGILTDTAHEKMSVIRHQTVRKKFKPLMDTGLPRMRHGAIHRSGRDEDTLAVERANRQEVCSKADVRVAIESSKPRHDGSETRQ